LICFFCPHICTSLFVFVFPCVTPHNAQVILSPNAVMADGGAICGCGVLMVCQAAHDYSIPVVCVTGAFTLTPLFAHNQSCVLNQLLSPAEALPYHANINVSNVEVGSTDAVSVLITCLCERSYLLVWRYFFGCFSSRFAWFVFTELSLWDLCINIVFSFRALCFVRATPQVSEAAFDYVPPELVSLYVTNDGNQLPSYVFRQLSEYYHPADYYIL
jgi:translation initiation factor 2B subunit (eIF-2B alpha/beta/delta family)